MSLLYSGSEGPGNAGLFEYLLYQLPHRMSVAAIAHFRTNPYGHPSYSFT